jgi:hypothetical protein
VDPPASASPDRKAWVAVPKYRSGATGFIDLTFDGTRFSAVPAPPKRRTLK